LDQARLVWAVLAPYDTEVAGVIHHSLTPVAQYVEPQIQVTGLQVLRSPGLEYAVAGAPQAEADDQALSKRSLA